MKENTAPELPPPIQIEQLAYAAAETQDDSVEEEFTRPVEVSIEEVIDVEAEKEAARKKLEKVYKQSAEIEPVEETPELPDEAKRERRAEIKKDDPATDDDGLASSIGQILADLHQKTTAAHQAFNRLSPKKGFSLPLPPVLAAMPIMYRQAVIAGFGAALLTLVSMLILT